MKITKIAALLKRGKRIIIYDAPDDTQWIGDGGAAFPLFNIPRLDEESAFAIFDISEKQQEKFYFHHTQLPEGINFTDTDPCENQLENKDITINTDGFALRPLETQKGLVCIDTKYLAPFSDVLDMVELYERTAPNGDIYIAVKAGLMLVGVIMPTKHAIKKDFVEQLERFAHHCRHAFETKEQEKAEREAGQTALDE